MERRDFLRLMTWAGASLPLAGNLVGCSGEKEQSAVQTPRKSVTKGGALNKTYKRVLLLGMDGLDPVLLNELMAQGQLPNFAKLKTQGFFGSLSTSNPPQSPVAWANIAIGANPGKHGLYDFICRIPKTYTPDLGILKLNRRNLLGSRDSMFLPVRHGTTFWEVTAAAGIPSTVLKWPVTFPPRESKARVLAGLGVPDITGGLGRYTFYSNVPPKADEEGKEKVVVLSNNRGAVETHVHGPLTQKLTSKKPSTIPLILNMNPEEGKLILEIQGQKHTLKEGDWTPWIELTFDVGPFKKVSGIAKFHLEEMRSRVALYLSPLQIDPRNPCYPITNPDEYASELESQIGRFHTLGIPEDTKALTEERLNEEAFLESCEEIVAQQEKMLDYELNRFKEGLLCNVFFTTDRVHHIFWVTRDPGHPLYNEAYAKKYGDMIPAYYRKMDNVLKKILPDLDDRTALIVCSDHGFASYRQSFHLNSWLIQQGLMSLKEAVDPNDREGAPLFRNVDWQKTKAYALGFGSLYLNRAGREGKGTVSDGEAPALTTKIADELSKVANGNGGQPVIAKVYKREDIYRGPFVESSPDLIVGYHPGYRASWQTAIGGMPEGLLEDNLKKWSGDHCIDPSAVPGIFLSNFQIARENPSNMDIAPTVLRCLGLKPDPSMEGASLV